MALKDDLVAAQLETVHQPRAEFQSEIAPAREQLGQVQINTAQPSRGTQALNERLVAVEAAKIADEVKFAQMEASFKSLEQRLANAQSSTGFKDRNNPAYCRLALVTVSCKCERDSQS